MFSDSGEFLGNWVKLLTPRLATDLLSQDPKGGTWGWVFIISSKGCAKVNQILVSSMMDTIGHD